MPRALTALTSMQELKVEAIFTRAAIMADPDAADLVGQTDGWLEGVQVLDAQMLENLVQRAIRDAERSVANHRLDFTCLRFSDSLLLAVNKDRNAVRWKRYYDEAPTRFVEQPLEDQVKKVVGWLTTQEPLLEPHRLELVKWSGAAQKALDKDEASKQATAELNLAREAHAKELTRLRDALHRLLAARADERGLDRRWADAFFRQG